MDISGELQRDISHDVIKTRLAATGTVVPGAQIAELSSDIDKMDKNRSPEYCGSCYGGEPPESGCCNSCDDVREAYTRKGWSFGNPGGIDQVRIFLFSFVACRLLEVLAVVVHQRTLVRAHPGAGVGRLQHCRSRTSEQGRWEHPTLARTLFPSCTVQDLRARALLEE